MPTVRRAALPLLESALTIEPSRIDLEFQRRRDVSRAGWRRDNVGIRLSTLGTLIHRIRSHIK